jgi:hypothetical protein
MEGVRKRAHSLLTWLPFRTGVYERPSLLRRQEHPGSASAGESLHRPPAISPTDATLPEEEPAVHGVILDQGRLPRAPLRVVARRRGRIREPGPSHPERRSRRARRGEPLEQLGRLVHPAERHRDIDIASQHREVARVREDEVLQARREDLPARPSTGEAIHLEPGPPSRIVSAVDAIEDLDRARDLTPRDEDLRDLQTEITPGAIERDRAPQRPQSRGGVPHRPRRPPLGGEEPGAERRGSLGRRPRGDRAGLPRTAIPEESLRQLGSQSRGVPPLVDLPPQPIDPLPAVAGRPEPREQDPAALPGRLFTDEQAPHELERRHMVGVPLEHLPAEPQRRVDLPPPAVIAREGHARREMPGRIREQGAEERPPLLPPPELERRRALDPSLRGGLGPALERLLCGGIRDRRVSHRPSEARPRGPEDRTSGPGGEGCVDPPDGTENEALLRLPAGDGDDREGREIPAGSGGLDERPPLPREAALPTGVEEKGEHLRRGLLPALPQALENERRLPASKSGPPFLEASPERRRRLIPSPPPRGGGAGQGAFPWCTGGLKRGDKKTAGRREEEEASKNTERDAEQAPVNSAAETRRDGGTGEEGAGALRHRGPAASGPVRTRTRSTSTAARSTRDPSGQWTMTVTGPGSAPSPKVASGSVAVR